MAKTTKKKASKEKSDKMGLFDWTKNILESKKPIPWSPKVEREYTPFIISRALVNYIDCIMIVNELNKLGTISKKLHYTYLFNAIPKKRRGFQKGFVMAVKKPDEDVLAVCKIYSVSPEVAMDYMNILTPENITTIKATLLSLNSNDRMD